MRAGVWVGFAVFCVAAGSRWLLDQVLPSPLNGVLRLGLHHLLLALIWALWCVVRRVRLNDHWARTAVLCAAVWALPEIVISSAGGQVSGLSEALVFTLAPVVAVFAVAQQALGFGDEAGTRQLVSPAFAGVVGAGLLIPFDAPPSATGRLWLGGLVVAVIAATLAAVRLHEELRAIRLVAAALLTSGAVALCGLAGWDRMALAGMDRSAWVLEAGAAICVDGPLLLLGLWLLREMRPVGAATRYPVVLLVTVLESFVLLHGSAGWEMVLGAILMAGSAAWLLRASALPVDETGDTRGTLGL